jgi:hypothetical protein
VHSRPIDQPATLAPCPALTAVTVNALVMGLAGVTAPVGWVLLPGIVATSARRRVVAVVSTWAGLLVIVSVLLPIIPGHRADVASLTTSAVLLAISPVMAWARERVGLDETTAQARKVAASLTWTTLRAGRRCAGRRCAGGLQQVRRTDTLSALHAPHLIDGAFGDGFGDSALSDPA